LPRPPASGEDPGVTLDVLTLGEPLVAFVAVESGSLADAAAFRRHVAGAETNLAVGLARLGVRAGIVARVGDDGLGTAILRRLRAEGVDVEGVSVDAGAPTGVLIRERRAFGPSEVLYRRAGSAGSRLAPDDLGASGGLRGARWLHVTGITSALSPTARAAVDGAIAAARKAGATVSFDVNLRRRLWSEAEAAPVLTALARRADVVLGDPDELALASGGQDPVASLLEAGVSMVITKAGASGVRVRTREGEDFALPALAVRVVDPVGAGDAFCAGFIAARLDGLDLATALRWGLACGAAVVSVDGDLDGLPTRPELARLLDAGAETIR
jgi:2-dehydro-3-deoxygluconokinase